MPKKWSSEWLYWLHMTHGAYTVQIFHLFAIWYREKQKFLPCEGTIAIVPFKMFLN